MRSFAIALVGAVASAAYWYGVAIVDYGLVGGDPGPGAPRPSAATQNAEDAIILAVAVVIYAVGILLWRLEARLSRSRAVPPAS